MAIFQQATLTNLRNLQYGSDTIGGGNSGEPYITTAIPPALQQQVESTNIWNSDSGLIRGGFVGATRASLTDFARIGKFLKDPPRGPMFIIKQVGLQLSNPQLEAPIGSPLTNFLQGNFGTLLGGSSTSAINIGPTRIYNGGINTLLQVPVNAFGGHIIRHGLLPIESESAKYENVARNNDPLNADEGGKNNRLVRLKAKLEPDENADIARYISGPSSLDVIWITTIQRYYNTLTNNTKPYLPLTEPLKLNQEGIILNDLVPINNNGYLYAPINPNYYNAQGVSLQYFNNSETLVASENNILIPAEGRTNNFTENSQFDQNVINYSATGRTYNTLRKAIDNQQANNQIGNVYLPTEISFSLALGAGPIEEYKIKTPLKFTPTGKSKYKNSKHPLGLDLLTNNIDTRLGLAQSEGSGAKDSINLTPVYLSDSYPSTAVIINGKEYGTRDLIKFRIEAVDNDTPTQSAWMIFRAYLKDITDTPNPTWNTVNYVGRGEPFYIYKGFERSLSFTLQVAAMSEEELKPMWQKLNFLYSNTMPDYSSNNVMRSPYMRLTLGDYMFRQPGIIKNMTYTIGNDSPWEIALDEPESGSSLYELPHVMTIQMTFAPIHDFLPRKFPSVFAEPEKNFKKLPAFVADRQTNQYGTADNPWLTGMYTDYNETEKLPSGKPK